ERPATLSPIGRASVETFMGDFASYLTTSNWRSYWGQYASERSGPRTNNAVEKANRMIKEEVTDNRRRRTLSEFNGYLNNGASWAKISQYGHATNKGEITDKYRRFGARSLATESLCQVPRTWKTTREVDPNDETEWLFIRDPQVKRGVESLSCHVLSDDDLGKCAKKFYEADYTTLQEAHELTSTFCAVRYSKAGGTLSSYCTCSTWRKNLVCGHLAAVAHLSGGDSSR
ncbi:hypothetical protein FOZ62_012907, partial [Perkinsus olseni]